MPKLTTLLLDKLKSQGDLRLALEHNTRDRPPPYANKEKSPENFSSRTTEEAMAFYRQNLPSRVRKNAVHAVEFVVQASPEETDKDRYLDYFVVAGAWICGKLGGVENRVHWAIHLDEETPHFHLIMMPLKDGALNYNAYLGGNKYQLRNLQTDFAREVGAQFGLERGIERSGINNRYHGAYRTQMAKPLTDLPKATLPEPHEGLSLKAYGEEISKCYEEAYADVIDRLTAVTNKARILEDDKRQVMQVSSGRAKEIDELLAEVGRLNDMIRDGGKELIDYQNKLRKEEEKKRTEELEKEWKREEREEKAAALKAEVDRTQSMKKNEQSNTAPKNVSKGRKKDRGDHGLGY
jgi:hypothetical protein